MKSLFDETQINGMKLKNRFFRSATFMNMCDDEGYPLTRFFSHYENLAKGGVGTIITGYARILEEEEITPNMLGLYDDKFIPEIKRFTDNIHKYDANIIAQLAHGGSQSRYKADERIIMSASAVEREIFEITPEAMTKEDIKKVVNGFAQAALRAKKAGFDGVQIHAAHGYLLSQFLSPQYNIREDEYGGNIENRAKIVFEVYGAIREAVGEDYNIFIKINCDDFTDKGFKFKDSIEVCKMLDKKGINAIEISGGIAFNPEGKEVFRKKITSDKTKQSYFREYAAQIAEQVSAPIILVGGNRDYGFMSDILNTTSIEYFALSRTLLCEQDLVNTWQADSLYKPICVACNRCWSKEVTQCIIERRLAIKKRIK